MKNVLTALGSIVVIFIVISVLGYRYLFVVPREVRDCRDREVLELAEALGTTAGNGDIACWRLVFGFESFWRARGVDREALKAALASDAFGGAEVAERGSELPPQDYIERAPSDWNFAPGRALPTFSTADFPRTWDEFVPERTHSHYLLMYSTEKATVYGWIRWRG